MTAIELSLHTGREFAQARIALGLPVRPVARVLGVAHMTLQRWENSLQEVDSTRAKQWREALNVVLQERMRDLARSGYTRADFISGIDLGRALLASVKGSAL